MAHIERTSDPDNAWCKECGTRISQVEGERVRHNNADQKCSKNWESKTFRDATPVQPTVKK